MATSHLELTSALSRWLNAAGIADDELRADLAVDLADTLHAAEVARAELGEILKLQIASRGQAALALQHAANIEVQLFSELKHHLEELESRWPLLMEALDERAREDPA
jgi:hypothetical protein